MTDNTDPGPLEIFPERKQIIVLVEAPTKVLKGRIMGQWADGVALVQFRDQWLPIEPSRINVEPCPKCGGWGDYVRQVVNGQPLVEGICYRCRGSGWVQKEL